MRAPSFVEAIPEVDIRGDIVHFTDEIAGNVAMHVSTCRAMHRRITEALVTFDTRPTAKVHSIRKPKTH